MGLDFDKEFSLDDAYIVARQECPDNPGLSGAPKIDEALLKAAARAAGYELDGWVFNVEYRLLELPHQSAWCPFTRIDDLYQLARRSGLVIDFFRGTVVAPKRDNFQVEFTPGDDDSEAYAIVRAAAGR
jgi:hypothetical protein